ncbi:hypothetical protein TTHERM_00721300 (macronuclear) [Tetrahymena thermophila SB210]|uniref:Uncharacterized protein n=1 Tax=Tetrahymena thermophila (strain SB210) TaxID=312017 RepID=Q22G27_TETTS|nr:hypothetical protein TTHERM_00721300 [Tetrahymena thermophila SB210]EAR84199.2 hypothetical protein TTHERM_00721300 [Tetrahymena thermophila SB210]|eukprot:XP_001031862.2 hypothetical protein TTHERM_00721300 [Tetrahymena thermophila SB210]
MSQDKIKGFIQYLKPSKDIQNQFFSKKKDQQSFQCYVLKNDAKVTPYRNPKCLTLECIYSQEDLVQKFTTDAEYNGNFKFTCQYCNAPIYLNAFQLDSNLQKIIDDSYQKNQSIKKITIYKNGKWDPVFDQSKNHLSMVDIPEEENEDSILPKIEDYSNQDLNSLMEKYKNDWPADFSETAFKALDMEVHFRDLYQIVFKNEVTIDSMRFLMAYMQNVNLKDKYKWKIFYIGVNMQNFDDSANTGNYQFIQGFENTLGTNYTEKWEYITIFFLYQGVWTLLIYKIKDKTVTALNYHDLDTTMAISKFLFSKILNIQPEINFLPAFEISNQNESQFSANLIYLFYYNLLVEKDFSSLKDLNKEGIETFKQETSTLKWLLLKCTERYIEKNNIQFHKKPSSIKQPSIQKTPSISQQQTLKAQSFQRQPTPKLQPIIEKEPSQEQLISNFVQSRESIRTPSQKNYNPSLNYITYQKPSPQVIQKNPTPYIPPSQNFKEEDNQVVQLSRDDLVNLLEKVRQNVLYEVNNPQKDLAKQYVEDINKFNVVLDKLDYMQPSTLKNQSILLSGQEMYNILDKFRNDLYRKIGQDRKYGINYIDPMIEKEEAEKNQQAFQQLLWYYYQYNPQMYKQLIDEYNHRFHNQLLEKMGLSEKFSLKKMQQQIIEDQLRNQQQHISQPQFNLNLDKNPQNYGSLNKSSDRLYNSLLNKNNSNDYVLQNSLNKKNSILLSGQNSQNINNNNINMSKESLNKQSSILFNNSYQKNNNFNHSSSFQKPPGYFNKQ